jgi:hypothetical protein
VTKTNQQIVTDAFNLIGVVADGKQPSPSQSATGISTMNDNILTQQRDGWSLGWYPQAQSNLTNLAPLRDEDIGDVTLCLCAWLAPRFGITIEPSPDPMDMANLGNQIKLAFTRLNKRSLRNVTSDLGELSRPQSSPWGGPGWI